MVGHGLSRKALTFRKIWTICEPQTDEHGLRIVLSLDQPVVMAASVGEVVLKENSPCHWSVLSGPADSACAPIAWAPRSLAARVEPAMRSKPWMSCVPLECVPPLRCF